MANKPEETHVSKGPLCYYLDRLSKRPDSLARLGRLREQVEARESAGYSGLVSLLDRYLFSPFAREVSAGSRKKITSYLSRYWFDERQAWWPKLQPIEPIFAIGLVKALTESIENPIKVAHPRHKGREIDVALPIDAYWVCVDEAFELAIARSEQQVTFLIMTPEPDDRRAAGVWGPECPIWVVQGNRTPGEIVEHAEWKRGDSVTGTVRSALVRSRR